MTRTLAALALTTAMIAPARALDPGFDTPAMMGAGASNLARGRIRALTLPPTDRGSSGDVGAFSAMPVGGTFARSLADLHSAAPTLESFIPMPAGAAREAAYAAFLADATPTLQAAANATCAKTPAGGSVRLPARTLTLPAKVPVSYGCAVHWLGSPPSEVAGQSGTWLRITGVAASPFRLTDPGARGTTFEHIGVYQDHPTPGPGWAPIPYPFVFDVQGTGGTIRFRDILAAPVYDLIRADGSGRLDTADIRGQVLHTAYWLDNLYDTSHLLGVQHFWPFWSFDANVMGWIVGNADLIVLNRVDGLEVPDFFAFGGRSAVRFQKSPTADPTGLTGFASKVHFGTLYADSTQYGVWNPVSGGGLSFQYPQARVENFEHAPIVPGSSTNASIPGSSGVRIEAAGGMDLSFGRASLEGSAGCPIALGNTATVSRLVIGDLAVSNHAGPTICAVPNVTNTVSLATTPTNGNRPITNGTAMTVTMPLPAGGIQPVVSGGAYTLPSNHAGAVFAGQAASYSITMPATPFNGQVTALSFTGAIAKLSILPQPGTGVQGAPSSVAANRVLRWRYYAGASAWFPE